MSEWKTYKFNQAVEVNPKVEIKNRIGIPFVEMKDIEPTNKFCTYSQKRDLGGGARFKNGDTLFARITPCLENGKIAQVRNLPDDVGFGSTEFHVLRGKKNITTSEFVYYLSRWDDVRDFAELNLHGTSGRQRFPAEAFGELEILLPSLPQQESIAEVLSSLDDKIDLLHQQNQTLEALAETLFREWFVEEVKEEWETKTVGEVFETFGGGTPSTSVSEYWDGNINWTSPKDLSEGSKLFMTNTSRTITEAGLKKISSGLLPIGTVLLSSRAPIGYISITDIPVSINQGYIACLRNEKFSTWYIHNWIKQNMDIIINSANGSTFLEISKSVFRKLEFVIPPDEKLLKFNQHAESYYYKIRSNEKQIQTLEALRNNLLPKLMSGAVSLSSQ